MYRTPPGILRSLRFGRLVTRVEWSFKGSDWKTIPFIEGSVTCDRNSTARWSATLTIPPPFRVDSRSGINPYGCKFRIFRGVQPIRRDAWMVPWGTYRVEEVEEDEVYGGLSLTMFSQEKQIEDARFPKPRYLTGPLDQIVETLVREAVPTTSISWDARLNSFRGLYQKFVEDKDRWGVMEGGREGKSLAASIGAEMYFDGNGNFRIQRTPRLSDAVAWEVDQEKFNFLLEAKRNFTRDSVFNVIAARHVASDGVKPLPPQFAWDSEPSSPTYAGPNPIGNPQGSTEAVAPFGVKTRYYSSPLFKTQAQMVAAAQSIKAESLGLQESFGFSCFLNPALEPADVIKVKGRRYIVDSWQADLVSPVMTGTTRSSKEDVADIEIQEEVT